MEKASALWVRWLFRFGKVERFSLTQVRTVHRRPKGTRLPEGEGMLGELFK